MNSILSLKKKNNTVLVWLVAALGASTFGFAGEFRSGSDLVSESPYENLVEALRRYRLVARHGGWAWVSSGSELQRGARGPRVQALRLRLVASGEMNSIYPSPSQVFDKRLELAVRKFQSNHNLPTTGRLDGPTQKELNVSVLRRIQTIESNLERWKWLPHTFASSYVLVDIASYRLNAYEAGKLVLTMRAIVGDRKRETPVFFDEISHVVVNPWWSIPRSIAIEEALPEIQRDPGEIEKNHLEVLKYERGRRRRVDVSAIDWKSITEQNFPFRFRQAPGPDNPLGNLKFHLPNRFDVYIHGTEDSGFFEASERAISHGCVRVESPLALARYALRVGRSRRDDSDLKKALEGTTERWITLPKRIPVYFGYWTAWAAADGQVRFQKDIYGWDEWDQELVNSFRFGEGEPQRLAE